MKNRNVMMCILIVVSAFVSLKQSKPHASMQSLMTSGSLTNIGDDPSKSSYASKIPSNETISFSEAPSTAFLPEYTFFALLVLQAGCQPLLIKLFMPPTIVRTTAVLGQEGAKFIASTIFLRLGGNWQESLSGWTISDSILAAGIPAGLYVIQNYCNLMANQVLPPVTFVVLNQTKTLSTAWCCFMLMGQRQSPVQIMSLVLLVFSALVVQGIIPLRRSLTKPTTTTDSRDDPRLEHTENESGTHYEEQKTNESLKLLDHNQTTSQHSEGIDDTQEDLDRVIKEEAEYEEAGRQLTMGVIPALCASFLSGLGK
jgi:hypothetical protein